MAQGGLQRRVGIVLLDQFMDPQRLTHDFIGRKIAASLHLPGNKLLLMRREGDFHDAKVTFAACQRQSEDSIPRRAEFLLKIHNLHYPYQEPPVDLGQPKNLVDGEAGAQGVAVTAF